MKKIAFISEHASPLATLGGVDSGGQNVYVAELSRHLAAMGYRIDVFTRREDPETPEVVDFSPGVRVVQVPAGPERYVRKEDLLPFMPAFTEFCVDFFNAETAPYDLVHANFWMSAWAAFQLKRRLGIPYVITFHALGRVRRLHQGAADEFPECRVEMEEIAAASADRVFAECPQDEEDLAVLYGVDRAKLSLVPCGFDPLEFHPLPRSFARAKIGYRDGERLILQLGRMVPRKGVENVIRGLSHLMKKEKIRARLVVVGGDKNDKGSLRSPELVRLRAVAEAEGVADHVDFKGPVERQELKFYYNAADVFVTTPWYEPFGITPLEAMACGTPVVGSAVGGVKYTVRDGRTGYLVPANDPEALAGRLAGLYRNPALLDYFSRSAFRHAVDSFTWKKIARTAAAVYEEILEPEFSYERLQSGIPR